ncbi:SPOR domain-containing protein [Pantoea coffeiphila]|uniref:Cell division protein DamX n=1 Tax=Pantoea coffeiphila TaxID=1465635 RepID=A0A2S9I8H3_9GAMM|nr:SPOR domain-containing protein [Pantoea coffeiphila]PRD14102.1 cell division protein DamX [Pantoea coffeiphila]
MDEFKPEDELKPDTSDRRPPRSRKTSSLPKVPVSRQHMMMGVGILVLLLLVLGIGSALKTPDAPGGQTAQQPAAGGRSGGEKNIDLSGTSSMSGQTAGQPNSAGQSSSPQELSAPQISSTPTEAAPLQTPQNQQRVELPGDLNNALNNQQGQVDAASQAGIGSSSLPTGQATVGGSGSKPAATKTANVPHQNAVPQNKPAAVHSKPSAAKPVVKESKPSATASHSAAPRAQTPTSVSSAAKPGGNYTLQLSSASRSDTLNAWARKQNLSGYHVYQTTRNGQPWYVLVSGSYNTSADAKRAVASLPAEVRAQNPWVKPVSQVKKEAGH